MGALPHDFVLFAGPLGTEYQTGVINSITGPQAIEDSSSVGTGLFDVKPLFSTNQYSARIDALEAFNNGRHQYSVMVDGAYMSRKPLLMI